LTSGVWRGGYNSGKINSINRPYLNLEAGVNRVAIRSTREPGTIKLTATSPGLPPATIEIPSHPADITDGYANARPPTPLVKLPKDRPAPPGQVKGQVAAAKIGSNLGRFVTGFNYTGPTAGATVHRNARPGQRVYTKGKLTFEALPDDLNGADWIQLPSADRRYSAEDLIEMQVKAGTRVYVAHDERLTPPAWLTSRFKPSKVQLTVGGHATRVFERAAENDESLTLGSNTDDPRAAGNMYVVFVNGSGARTQQRNAEPGARRESRGRRRRRRPPTHPRRRHEGVGTCAADDHIPPRAAQRRRAQRLLLQRRLLVARPG
jgi:beta-galactosidase